MDWERLVATARWLRRRAENVSAALLLIMFLCFILTIVARYVFNYPLGWTEEASLIAWIWCTLWGAVFVLREKDEVRFDIFYSSLSDRARCICTVITGTAAIVTRASAGTGRVSGVKVAGMKKRMVQRPSPAASCTTGAVIAIFSASWVVEAWATGAVMAIFARLRLPPKM